MKARFFALAALVLGLASCQQEFDGAAPVGGEVDFQLKVDAKELATRANDGDEQYGFDSAYGAIDYLCDDADDFRVDWKDVDLRYTLEVYDANGLNAAPVKDRMVQIVDKYEPVTFDLRLVPNRDYQFVVFADFVPQGASAEANTDIQKNLGLHHVINGTLQNITIKEDAINDECTDAYFATEPIRISNSAAQSIILKRPYGKVRVIATDLHELNLNVEPKTVKVTYEAAHRAKFNAVNGAIDAEYETVVYENEYKDIKKTDMSRHIYTGFDTDEYKVENANGEVRNTHMTLFTDYILANVDQESIHFTMEVFDETGATIKKTNFNTDIPVQRNHLTTIVGNVLTTATEINVTIDDNFKGRHDIEVIFVSSFRELYEAVNNYKAGQVIIFEADIVDDDAERDIVILQKEGVNVVINGDGYKLEGGITINGDARSKGAETVLLKNINFYTKEAKTFIDAPTKMNGKYNYSHNITVDGCTFESETYNENVVGIKLQTTYNAVVKNSKAENIHTLAQFYSTDNKTVIENVKVENCKNGIALGNMAMATIKGANISAKGYGIRMDGEKTRTVAATIENATINAYIPVNIRKMNDAACNVDVEFIGENNVLTGSSDYEIAFCSNEYEEGVAPQNPVGTFRLQNAEEARAFYGNVTSFSAFDAAINSTNSDDVKVESDITKKGLGVKVERDVIIDFDNKVFNAGSDANSTWYAIEVFGAYDVMIKNANFTRAGIYAAEGADVVFDNGTINHKPERTSRYIFCSQSGSTITVKDGTFTNDRAKNSFFWADNSTIIVEGGNFGGVASTKKVVTSNGGQVIIKGGTFNFDPTAWVVSTSVVEKVGSNWVVTPITPSNNISDAISGVEDGGKIVLVDGTYDMPAVSGKEVTIVGSKDVVITVNKPNMSGSDVTFEGVTVKGSGYATGVQHVNNVTYNDVKVIGEMCLYGENVVFNNCVFELNNQYIWTYGAKNAAFNNCVFNTNGKAILVYNEGAGACEVEVKGCTFNATAGAKAGAIANQNCAAIEIDNFQSSGVGAAHKVTASENTYNSEDFSGEWRIKNFVAGNAITVNGVAYEQIAVDGKKMTIDADKNVTVL